MPGTSVEIPVKPVGMLLDEAVTRFGASPAMDFFGRRWSYAELGDLVSRVAGGLRRLGVGKGIRVGLCLPNSPYYVICYYAVLKTGGIVVNYNPLYVERELAHQVEDSGTTIMVTLDREQAYTKVAALLDKTCLERVVVCRMDDTPPADIPDDSRHAFFDRLALSAPLTRAEEIDPHADVAVLQYTGGTTGVPKGAALTHANLSANVEQLLRWVPNTDQGHERVLCVIPFFHVFAMTVAMNLGVAKGAELIILPRFEIDQVMKVMTEKRPTIFPGVPTIFIAINEAAKAGHYDLSHIHFCIAGGAPLPMEVRTEFERLTHCRVVEGYGLSEASPVVTCNPVNGPVNGLVKDGSIGLALPGTTIEILCPVESKRLGVGEKGEITVRGPQVMAGYWRRPKDTALVMIEGALRTGDVGYMDEDGYVFLVDRIKDLILCGGYNVYPRVIEEALYRHPAVAEVVVIGIPDPYRGQAPKAFVRLRDGAAATPDELKEFLSDHLSRVEMPKLIELRDELPKTMVGKLSKKQLVDEENNARNASSSTSTS